ncbi:MAG: type II toxin-antitoxin system VapC family toxin [Spirulina sp.]
MSNLVLLDSGVVGMVTNPKANPICENCRLWLDTLSTRGYRVALPEIADYEVRRELLRAGRIKGIGKLDRLKDRIQYLPITTSIMLKAAELWAEARRRGRPTADPKSLDGDVILAAQAMMVQEMGYDAIVATTNAKHLSLFVDARDWQAI